MNRNQFAARRGNLVASYALCIRPAARVVCVAALMLFSSANAQGATWSGGTGVWNQVNGTPWGGTAPVAGNPINLTQAGGPFTISYLAGTDAVSPLYGALALGNTSNVTTLSVGGNGGTAGEETLLTGDFNVNNGGKVALNTGGKIGPGPVFASIYVNGGGSVEQTGGTWVTNNGDLTVASTSTTLNAYYVINGAGALLNPRQTIIGQSQFGGGTAGTATFDLINGTVTNSSTNVQVGHSSMGTGILNISGGSMSGNLLNVHKTGIVNFSNGGISFANEGLHGGVMNQSGGTNAIVFSLRVADTVGQAATYQMSTGAIITARELLVGANFGGGPITVGGKGTFVQNGGSITLSGNSSVPGLQVSHGSATDISTYTFRNGTLLGNTNKFTIETLGVFQGYGTVGITGAFTNFGRIIANGEGIDRTLSLAALGTLATAENVTNKGWFAVDHGKLTLRGVAITATTNWGEQTGDVQIDMVNSAQLTFSGLTGSGTLDGSLLAVDRTDVAAAPNNTMFTSVHQFSKTGTSAFSSYNLGIRFDDLTLPGGIWTPGLFQLVGGSWVNVMTSIDYVNSMIYANGLTTLGTFAVGATAIPEPSSCLLLGLGALGLVRQSRRRRIGSNRV